MTNCSVKNHSSSSSSSNLPSSSPTITSASKTGTRSFLPHSLLVSCRAGDGGGLRQSFHLEIYSEQDILFANITDVPRFRLFPSSSSSGFTSTSSSSLSSSSSSPSSSVVQTTSSLSSSLPDSSSMAENSVESSSSLSDSQSLSPSSTSSLPPDDSSSIYFVIPSLPSESKFTLHIFATNSRGRSPGTIIAAPSFTLSEKQTRGMCLCTF